MSTDRLSGESTPEPPPKKSHRLGWILGSLGLAVTGGLVAWLGFGEILSAITTAGWGILAVCAYHAGPLVLVTLGWMSVLPPARPPLRVLLLHRWVAESINNLLPVAQVGGDIVRARLASVAGVPGPASAASVVIDATAGLLGEIIFALAGLGILFATVSGGAGRLAGILAGVLVLGGMLLGLAWVQKSGISRKLGRAIARVGGGERSLRIEGGAAALDRALGEAYSRPWAFVACCAWRLAAWTAGAGEVWLALHFMGRPVSVGEAIILESLGQAARTAGFLVPGALGVQEGSYIFIGGLANISPAMALSLSIVKRVRELLLGLPGLLAWQIIEWRHLTPAEEGAKA